MAVGKQVEQAAVFARDPVAGMAGCMEVAAGARQVPHLLGHAMHVNGEADPAVADKTDPQFLLPHGHILEGEGYEWQLAFR